MHGFKLADCELYVEHKMLPKIIEQSFRFLRTFNEAESVRLHYEVHGFKFIFGIFRHATKDMYFINIFVNNTNVTSLSARKPIGFSRGRNSAAVLGGMLFQA